MNTRRVLRTSNVLLLLTGYQMHWFDSQLQRYRISAPGILNVFVLACIYAGCFNEHFQPSALLKTLLDVSPFLYGLTRLQLLLSIKVFAYAIYASVRAVGVAGEITESLPMTIISARRGCLKRELIAYLLLFSTFVVLLCFGLYIGYEMQFKLPPLQHIMIGVALFLPHLVLAGALRFYCIFAWLTRERLRQLESEVEQLLSESKIKTELQLVANSSSVAVTVAASNEDNLLKPLQQLAAHFGNFFDHLQRSLLLLLGVNANCLLFGFYTYVYFSNTWHVLFDDHMRRVFYAGNISIYACIGCDYACLLLAQSLLEQQIQLIQLLVVALIVTCHYLNDAILQTNERFDSNDEDD
ncbi:GH10456 [Drosophila grimshawi]|uniref:GH10456 n=1 Tax=Drosophila grimshawi TaxID=7222 RepID=B4JE05_DROGR|nr:GH10456 [Drosophila grimshawi]